MVARETQIKRNIGKQNQLLPAVVLGGAVLGAAFILSSGKEAPAAQERPLPAPIVGQFDVVSVPVPTKPVSVGMSLKKVSFRNKRFPRHQVPTGALTDIGPFSDAVAVAPLPADLPIFKANLSLKGGVSNPIIERIPEGMRAITVRVDATAAVEGWAAAGAVVDVMLVGKERSSIVAESVKILSAERSIDPISGAAQPDIPSTVTLLVDQTQALAIQTATNNGKISFALRNMTDEGDWKSPMFEAQKLNGKPRARKQVAVNGYISVSGDDKKSFALVDGKWISSQSKPQGFLVTED